MPDKLPKEKKAPANPSEMTKPEKAFLQVPLSIKDQVETYIQQLSKNKGSTIPDEKAPSIDVAEQGCFLVISLDKIEKIVNNLQSCLMMAPDSGADNIKKQIRETLSMLS